MKFLAAVLGLAVLPALVGCAATMTAAEFDRHFPSGGMRMSGRLMLAVALGLTLTGCAMVNDVKLRHADGRVVTCEPGWRYGVIGATLGHDQVRDCVRDYQRQGYERIP